MTAPATLTEWRGSVDIAGPSGTVTGTDADDGGLTAKSRAARAATTASVSTRIESAFSGTGASTGLSTFTYPRCRLCLVSRGCDLIALRVGLSDGSGSVALAGDLEGRQGCRARPKAADSRHWGSRPQRRTRSRSSGGQPAGVASAVLQRGQAYRDFHAAAWVEASRVCPAGVSC
jgi:hypothetical protein